MTSRPFRSALAAIAGSLCIALAGCAGPAATSPKTVYFPPAPSLPRLQFLTGINGSQDVEGKLAKWSLFSFGKTAQKSPSRIIKPYGISTAGGKIYVADIAGQVAIIDPPRKSFELLKGNNGIGKLKKPVKVAVDELGFIYVADVGRKEVVVYDQEGEFLKTLGGDLSLTPSDVAVDRDRVYVLSTKEGVIKVIDRSTGALLSEIGKKLGTENNLSLPMSFTLDSAGIIRITNAGNGKVVSVDRDGNFLGSFGELGDGFGQFARPKGIAANDKGEIYVVDAGLQNVQIFNEKGRILTYFGSNKLPVGGMNLPSGVALSRADLAYYQTLADKNFELEQVIFVANQFGDPKVSVYGYGKRRGIDYEAEYLKLQADREKKAREAIEKAKRDKEQAEAPSPAGADR